MAEISEKIYREFVDIVYRESGIVLEDKRELLAARLASLCRKKGYRSPEDILDQLRKDASGDIMVDLLDQVSTNLTYFFREPAHFDHLAGRLLPELIKSKRAVRDKRIRFWSAACSSGEEAYSLAMTAMRVLEGDPSWDLKILATDISTRMLRKAMTGQYLSKEVFRAPSSMVRQYFNQKSTGGQSVFEVRDEIKRLVSFRRLNLLQDQYPFSGPFDLILCRNVMIYFDDPTRRELLQRFHRYLADGGYLYAGHAESLAAFDHLFHREQTAVYRK